MVDQLRDDRGEVVFLGVQPDIERVLLSDDESGLILLTKCTSLELPGGG